MRLSIELISQCYAATSWEGAHVDGQIEWPPAPWRILRALYAGYFHSKGAGQVPMREEFDSLMLKLMSVLPSYYLPKASYVQVRTYLKDQTNDQALYKSGTQLISGEYRFDSTDCVIEIDWPVDLTTKEVEILKTVLPYCGYLGRRECDARWFLGGNHKPNCLPTPSGDSRIMIPTQSTTIEQLLKPVHVSTCNEMRQHFEGASWVQYRLDQSFVTRSSQNLTPSANYCRFALIGDYPLPATSVLSWAEKLHKLLVKQCPTPTFTGCDANGNPLNSHHHAYTRPIFGGDKLTHLEVVSPVGFSSNEIQTLLAAGFRSLYGKGSHRVFLRVAEIGDRYLSTTVFESCTPFFLSRTPARRGKERGYKPRMISGTQYQKDGPEHQTLKGLTYLPQFEDITFEYQDNGNGLEAWAKGEKFCVANSQIFPQWWKWKRDRQNGKLGAKEGYYIRLEFSKEISFPLSLGYAAHFGLGCLRESVAVKNTVESNKPKTLAAKGV